MNSMSLLSLQRYAEWYYTRYFPSIAVLREKILKKSADPLLAEEVLSRLETLFVEKNIIESYLNQYIGQDKTLFYVKQKLRQKKFDPVLVTRAIDSVKEIFEDPEHYRKPILAQLQKAKEKGWSKMKLSYSLRMNFPQAQSLIGEILSDYDDREILSHIIIPQYTSLSTEQSIISKSLKQWFRLSDIQKVLREEN